MGDQPDFSAASALAQRAAYAAAAVLGHEQAAHVHSDHGRDLKLNVDRLASQAITQVLQATPWPIFDEEEPLNFDRRAVSAHWIVDPLDGTVNFSRHVPLYAISIALWQGDEPRVGVIYEPMNARLYHGVVGSGAWCNGKALALSGVERCDQAILATGLSNARAYDEAALSHFTRVISTYKKVRMLGSAALSLAYVASGQLDVYWEQDIFLWDIAAGAALVAAAGGDLRWRPAARPETCDVWAGKSSLFAAVGEPSP